MMNENKKRCPQGCGCGLCSDGGLREDRNHHTQQQENVPLQQSRTSPKKSHDDKKNKETRKEHVRKGGGGPTTEAGKKKKAEVEAAKAAKKALQQERNRKKRDAYRERQRAKKTMPSSREQARRDRNRKQQSNDGNSSKKKKDRTKENGQRRHDKHETYCQQVFPNGTFNEVGWKKLMKKALQKQDFDKMRDLFMADLKHVASRKNSNVDGVNTTASIITKRFRVLSCRFHPDKNVTTVESPGGEHQYKVAFQALNEAHDKFKQLSSCWF